MIELKLDTDTPFEWQKHCQARTDMPQYGKLLDFIDLRAQASETSCPVLWKQPVSRITTFATNTGTSSNCVVCRNEEHQFYICAKFRFLPHGDKVSIIKTNNLCSNCLAGGHFKKHCKSIHKCNVCQKPHHTLLHMEQPSNPASGGSILIGDVTHVSSTTAVKLKSNALLMT